jgi:hypothetical protein
MTEPVSGTLASCFDPASEPGSHEANECPYEVPTCSKASDAGQVDDAFSAARRADSPEKAPWGLRFCRDADTVVEGFLCDEPVVVSNACRKPSNSFDAYICDEPRMRELERGVVRETWTLLKALLSQLFLR